MMRQRGTDGEPGVSETKSKTKIGGSNRGRNDDEG